MNALVYPQTAPDLGAAAEVAPGLWWLRMPLPIPALKHINLWLADEGDGWTVIDTGYASDEARAVWEKVFTDVMGGRPVHRVIVTHFHPDHIGLAGWLCSRFGADLWMTQTEWLLGRTLQLDAQVTPPSYVERLYVRAGVDKSWIEFWRVRPYDNYSKNLAAIPPTYRRIHSDEHLRIGSYDWRVIIGRGHAPEQSCLYAAAPKLLIAGDQILPRISPNIGVYAGEPDANPLPEYLSSLDNFADCAEDSLVLPSHGEVFTGLHARIAALKAHHGERIEFLCETLRQAGGPLTAAQLGEAMFRHRFTLDAMAFVVGETLSHLHLMIDQGKLRRLRPAEGPDLYELT